MAAVSCRWSPCTRIPRQLAVIGVATSGTAGAGYSVAAETAYYPSQCSRGSYAGRAGRLPEDDKLGACVYLVKSVSGRRTRAPALAYECTARKLLRPEATKNASAYGCIHRRGGFSARSGHLHRIYSPHSEPRPQSPAAGSPELHVRCVTITAPSRGTLYVVPPG